MAKAKTRFYRAVINPATGALGAPARVTRLPAGRGYRPATAGGARRLNLYALSLDGTTGGLTAGEAAANLTLYLAVTPLGGRLYRVRAPGLGPASEAPLPTFTLGAPGPLRAARAAAAYAFNV